MGKQKFQNPISLRLTNVLTFGNLSKLDNLKDNELTVRNICHIEWEYCQLFAGQEEAIIYFTKIDETTPRLFAIVPALILTKFEELMEGLSNECKFNYDSSTIQLISEAISLSQEDSCEDNDSLPTLQELRQFPLLTPDLLHGADTLLQNSPCPTQSSTEQNVSKILIRS